MNTVFLPNGHSRDIQSYYDAVEILETALMHDGIEDGETFIEKRRGTSV